MRKFTKVCSVSAVVCVGLIVFGYAALRTRAQDTPPAVLATPSDVISQIMSLVGQSRIDEAIALMDGFKNQPELREAARTGLLHLREEDGTYRGYDIAAVQKFTGQFQTDDVMAYYDEQPVLFRFHFYRPQTQDNTKWVVLGFQVSTTQQEITEVLKDTPAEYPGHSK
jgi:hypothetical protein